MMLLLAIVTTTVRVAALSSPIQQEFSPKNGFEEEDKEKGGEEKMEGFVHRSKRFLPINLPNPKGESFDVEGIEEGRSKIVGLNEKWREVFLGVLIWAFSTHLARLGFWLVLLVGNPH